MAHLTQRLPNLQQTDRLVKIGDSSNGTVLRSELEGVLKVWKQNLTDLGTIKTRPGVDADDAVVMAQHDALASRILSLETLMQSDDATLDVFQEMVDFVKNNRADIDSLTTTYTAGIAAVQADVDQNEIDSDAADAALAARATALEAFKALFDSAISVIQDGANWDTIIKHDLNINGNIQSNGTQIFNSTTKELKNVASVDSSTDAVLSATGIAYTDALAAKHSMRYKQVLHSASASAYFGSIVKADTFVTKVTIKVNTAFDGNATLSIGDDNDLTLFGDLNAANMSSVGVYSLPVIMKLSADKQPKYTISGSPTQGDLEIFLEVSA
ncbi:MAG: hypothetical protein GY739_19385 [Mesoflavibacter sp.]|nr:hypothetical protein [Mesoflavibacter sp.]